jgi:hypothetical protein
MLGFDPLQSAFLTCKNDPYTLLSLTGHGEDGVEGAMGGRAEPAAGVAAGQGRRAGGRRRAASWAMAALTHSHGRASCAAVVGAAAAVGKSGVRRMETGKTGGWGNLRTEKRF